MIRVGFVHYDDPTPLQVAALKGRVEEAKGGDFQKDSMNVIHQGKILKDDATLQESGITDKSFCVVMAVKKKAAPAPAPTVLEEPATTTATEASALPPEAPAGASVAAIEPPAATDSGALGSSELLTGAALEDRIAQICEIGFPRDQVIKAMRAAFNNSERAVEYLMTGIPEGLLAPEPQVAAAGSPGAAPPSTQPFNMFAPSGGEAGTVPAPVATGPLDFLRNDPQFQALRALVQQNPQLLQPMLQELGRNNPDLLARINEHQQDFISLVNEPVDPAEMEALMATMAEDMGEAGGGGEGEGDGAGGPEGAVQIELSQEEADAVARLEGMGFPRALCLEAFLICDRNEQLAANYLLENGMDD